MSVADPVRPAETVVVLRDGRRRRVPACTLVPGDVVVRAEGDHVPADARLVDGRLQIDTPRR